MLDWLQVWSACKPPNTNTDDSQPTHEIDVLAGHENDVNYVQFRLVGTYPLSVTTNIHPSISSVLHCSGCAVASRSLTSDTSASTEEKVPKFKTSWSVTSVVNHITSSAFLLPSNHNSACSKMMI